MSSWHLAEMGRKLSKNMDPLSVPSEYHGIQLLATLTTPASVSSASLGISGENISSKKKKWQYCKLGALTLFEMVPVNSVPSMARTSLQIGASALILLALIQIMLLCCQLLIRPEQSMCCLTAHGRKVWWQQPGCIPIMAPGVINRLTFLENSAAFCSLSSTFALSTHWSVKHKQTGTWKKNTQERKKNASICKLQGALLTPCLRFHIRHRMKTIKKNKKANGIKWTCQHLIPPPPSPQEICIQF